MTNQQQQSLQDRQSEQDRKDRRQQDRLSRQQAERLLEAGAVLAPGAVRDAGRPDSAVDVLTARTYQHPALDGRQVVRLVPGALGPAEDLALDFLGLLPVAQAVEVGQVRQEALGFPAWALVHDPANGHHALALVKEMERLARLAKSKPGHAKDGFDELAVRLGRAVPHFLPTFCEQAGRIFLELGNQTYAGMFFGKAREAERVHRLTVDEERLRAVFLEFALGGALTVKALRQYVKELAGRLDAGTAWARFCQLCAERSAAGMAPYAGIVEDARSLIKAAGLDRAEAERELLAELIGSAAVNRAPATFWQSWRGPLVELARAEASVRARLLEILPTPPGTQNNTAAEDAWVELLVEAGADRILTEYQLSDTERLLTSTGADPAARWLQRWAAHLGRGWRGQVHSGPTLDLAARMAPRLRAEGEPVDLLGDPRRRQGLDLNLLDLLLAEGVPVADPPAEFSLNLRGWLQYGGQGRRDLVAVAADARFRPILKAATAGSWQAGWESVEGDGKPVLTELFREWADDRAEELLAARGLAGARGLLSLLSALRPAVMAANPRAAERIASLDVPALLARTLRAGILDELAWPALEDGLRRLGVEEGESPGVLPGQVRPGGAVLLQEAWPALILYRDGKVVVVGPQQVLMEHELRIPDLYDKGYGPRLRYVDGELLVIWWHDGAQRAYWSGRPAEVFTLTGEVVTGRYWRDTSIGTASVPLPGGGRATGDRALHAGDTVLPPSRPVLADGTGYWTVRNVAGRSVTVEYDPATGATGRASLPPHAAPAAEQGGHPHAAGCSLLPMQPGLEQSPLGTDGKVLGHWLRLTDRQLTAGGTDGRTVTLRRPAGGLGVFPLGRLALPEGAQVLLLNDQGKLVLCAPGDGARDAGSGGGDGNGEGSSADYLASVEPGGHGHLHAAGTAVVPPAEYWHALRPRDERGSRLLRAVSDRQAAELFDAAWPVDEGEEAGQDRGWLIVHGVRRRNAGARATAAVPLDAVRRILPELDHPLLRAGVAGLARLATDTAVRAARYAAQPEAEPAAAAAPVPAPYQPQHGRDHELRDALDLLSVDNNGFGPGWGEHQSWHVLANLRAVAARLAAPAPAAPPAGGWAADPEPVTLHEASRSYGWISLLGRMAPVAFTAAAPLRTPQERASLSLLLAALTQGWFADRGAELRQVTLSEPLTSSAATGWRETHAKRVGEVLRHGDRTVVVIACLHHQGSRAHWLALDHDPSREFRAVADLTLVEERSLAEPPSVGPVAFDAAWFARFLALLQQYGGLPWRPESAEAFADATGIGRTRAALILAGAPMGGWQRTFLTPEQLTMLGLKSNEATEVRSWLRMRTTEDLDRLRSALLAVEPARLWSEGAAVAPAAELWLRRYGGRTVTVSDPARAAAEGASVKVIEELLNPADTAWLSRTTRQRIRQVDRHSSTYHLLTAEDPEAVPGRTQVVTAVRALRWLAYRLPYGDPLRPLLPLAHQALRDRLADPALLLDLDLGSTGSKNEPVASLLRARFGLPEQGGADADGLLACGPAIVLGDNRDHETPYLRTAGLTGPEDPLLDLLAGLTSGYAFGHELPGLRAVLGEELGRLVAEGSAAGEPAGWAQDPRRSAPAVVAEVTKAYGPAGPGAAALGATAAGLGEDAAVLYLQLLALPDPTDRNLALWTGWKPARLKQARTQLAATELVVEAKRARAGRSLFLPGGWQEAKAPGLPVEVWKAGLYPLSEAAVTLPQLPAGELFAFAWQRVQAGDVPGYEELRTINRRKARR